MLTIMSIAVKYSDFFGATLIFRGYSDNPIFETSEKISPILSLKPKYIYLIFVCKF